MSLYKGNNLISGAMPNSANQSLSNLDSAGQDIINSKANTNLSNLTATSSTNFDGQWVFPSTETVITTTIPNISTTGSISYDLSSLLPNDNYTYEIYITNSLRFSAVSGIYYGQVSTDEVPAVSIWSQTPTVNILYYGFSIIPITNRTLTYGITKQASATLNFFALFLNGYRRIGTNS